MREVKVNWPRCQLFIVGAAILIGGSIIGVTSFLGNSLNKMAGRIDVLDTKIEDRLPAK